MSPSGDYRGEMFGSREAEEILAGGRGDSDEARSAAQAVARIRAELLVSPDETLAQRHLDAMRAGRSWSDARRRAPRNGRKQVAALALAASLMLGAGIAGALTLPDKASERAGERTALIELPDKAKGPGDGGKGTTAPDESSAHGQAVSEVARDDSTKGCEHGRAVSAAASSKSEDNRNSAGNRGDCGPKRGQSQKGNSGNHGEGNNGKGNNGKGPGSKSQAPKDPPGQGSKPGSQGQGSGKPSGPQSSNAGGNGKSDLALAEAPGQAAKAAKEAKAAKAAKAANEASETNITPDGLPADV